MNLFIRLSILISALWLLGLLAISISTGLSGGVSLFIFCGLSPLVILWGIGWVISGLDLKTKKILSLAIIVIAVAIGLSYLSVYSFKHYTGITEKALLNSRWGMSPSDIEHANHTLLETDELRGLSLLFEPPVLDQNRFKFLKSSDTNLFGKQTTAYYTFFDDQLYRYIVIINISNKQLADDEILPLLISKYGKAKASQINGDDEIEKYEWITKDQEISYSLYYKKTENKYEAVIRVKYIPIYNEINDIVKIERKSYF